MNNIKIANNQFIKINGRTIDSDECVYLIWSGASLEFKVKCSELSILVEAPYDTNESYIAIEINGAILSRHMLSKEKQWVPIFRNMNPNIETNVRIIKEVQAFASDKNHCIKCFEIALDGEFLPISFDNLKLEFIGDSITSAEGAIGAKTDMEWISQYFSHVSSYPYMVGKKLNADINVISQSGWGVLASYDNNLNNVIPKYYEDICSLIDFTGKSPFCAKWDFNKFKTDAVIVNLGTNDDGAFHFTEYTGDDNLRMNGDEFVEEDRLLFRDAVINFIRLIRKNNSNAYIYWAFGIYESGLTDTIREAVDLYKENTNDDKVRFLQLPVLTDKTKGSREHPGRKAHKEASKVIIKAIKKDLHL